MTEIKTQKAQMFNHLLKGFKITHLLAFSKFNVLGGYTRRLSDIRQDLRELGIELQEEWMNVNGKRFKRCWIGLAGIRKYKGLMK